MHRIRVIGRPVALVAVTAVLLAIVAWFSGSVTQQDEAHADSNWADLAYISCSDQWLDFPPLQIKGEGPGIEDPWTGQSLTRGEPSQTQPGALDLTTVTYLGPDLDPNDASPIPGKAPTALTCQEQDANAAIAAENNRLNNRLDYAIVSATRPTSIGVFSDKLVVGEPPVLETNMDYITCAFSEALGTWSRIDVNVVMREKGKDANNWGYGKIYLNVTSPDGVNCNVTGETPYVDFFPFTLQTHTRNATTDHPEVLKNVGIPVDADGPSPKVKGTKQVPDGADGLADDWDGDGCPDWDELDQNAHGELEYANGLDPFNPHDCNQAVNIGGIYRIVSTVAPATKDPPTGVVTPGAYYHCIGDMQQDGDDLEMRIFCYIDIPGVPVNPQASPESGDGLEGVPPPPPYGDVDDVQTVLTGTHTSPANRIIMSGCFEDRDGESALGNVYVESDQDAHTGRGSITIYADEELADCLAGTPAGDGVPAAVKSVKVGEKGPCDKSEPNCAGGGQIDSDGDNCPDKNELSDNQQQGGLRDPYNRWDYMNPTHDGQNRVDDILATVNQYFIDKGNPDYDKSTDRTAVIGANPWNLGPPNGQQRVDDILASVKSYFHDCDGGKYDDPNDETNE